MEEFVIGFFNDDPEGLTPIDIVQDITGLSVAEIRSCSNTIKLDSDGTI